MKKQSFVILTGILILIIIPGYFAADLYYYSITPTNLTKTEHKIFKIPQGQSLNRTVTELHSNNLINSPLKFKLIARLKKYDRRIIAGEYELSETMTPLAILEHLANGNVRLHRLSIPEGFTIEQIASNVEKAGFCDKEDFIKASTDEKFAQTMQIPAKTFEGYLFPDTYFFSKDVSPKQIISSMVGQFKKIFRHEMESLAQENGFTKHEIVTLASIIEKETGAASERPLIASVFHNRLKKKMRLASDPTVIYGIKDFNGNITKKDLNTPTPYNTYIIKGLPPGPIANPGEESIKAALSPAKTTYLYFVSKKDKTHKFSTTLGEHNRAVRKYQLRRRPR